jgi:hypothetical protein
MRHSRTVLALALTLPMTTLSGCCSFARLFCGPDKTPWVSIDYTQPERAVRTLLEALRRDEPEVVYLSLSNDYRKRLGLDSMTAQLAWSRIRDANPGLHLAGYAEVPPAHHRGDDRAELRLDIEGRQVEVQLVRQSSLSVRYRRPETEPDAQPEASQERHPARYGYYECGQPIDSFAGFVAVEPKDGDDASRVTLAPWLFRHEGLDSVRLEDLEFAGIERQGGDNRRSSATRKSRWELSCSETGRYSQRVKVYELRTARRQR